MSSAVTPQALALPLVALRNWRGVRPVRFFGIRRSSVLRLQRLSSLISIPGGQWIHDVGHAIAQATIV
jgi:hypothetical protein